MRKTALLSALFVAALVFSIASHSHSASYTIYNNFANFQAALPGATLDTQSFQGYSHNDDLNGVEFLPGVFVTSNMDTIRAWQSLDDKVLFAYSSGEPNKRADINTRTYYDIHFNSKYKTVGFHIDAWNPSAGNGMIEIFFADATSFSHEIEKEGGSENDPVFFGIIADTSIDRIRWNEPSEVVGISGWEETALDDFAVLAERPLGALPSSQCTNFFEMVNAEGEKKEIWAKYRLDYEGCIIEDSVKFFKGPQCTDPEIPHTFENPDPDLGFVYKSGTRGGCAGAVEVTASSPACVTLTLKSGRKTKVCD